MRQRREIVQPTCLIHKITIKSTTTKYPLYLIFVSLFSFLGDVNLFARYLLNLSMNNFQATTKNCWYVKQCPFSANHALLTMFILYIKTCRVFFIYSPCLLCVICVICVICVHLASCLYCTADQCMVPGWPQ